MKCIKLRCKYCNEVFICDEKKVHFDSCPKCGKTYSDSFRIDDYVDKLLSYNDHLIESVEVLGIYKDSAFSMTVFSNDLKAISEIYESASEGDKNKIASIVDKVYLLLNSNGNEKSLEGLKSILDDYFYQGLELK